MVNQARRFAAGAIIAGTMLAQQPVMAEERVKDVFDDRLILNVHLGAVLSDDSDNDTGGSFGISLGKPLSDKWALEATLSSEKLETTSSGDYERTSLSVQGLYFFNDSPFWDTSTSTHFFGLAGVQVASIDWLGESLSGFGPVVGAGILSEFETFNLRVDARYKLDDIGAEGVLLDDETFYTWSLWVGLSIPLGERPRPPVVDGDDDGDGVPNSRDKCPNTPPGVQVGPDGCPLDSDGDGVPDSYDQCPNTLPGMEVDSKGCVIPQVFELRGVHFEFDKSNLLLDSRVILDRVVESLENEPSVKIMVVGHTDWMGSDAYNQRLSERRAQAVVDYLVGKGIDAERLSAQGLGESQPVASNETDEGRAQNRRVELHVLEGTYPTPAEPQ